MSRTISVWILADQLTPNHPALWVAIAEEGSDRVRVVMVESRSAMTRLPFHRKRQVLHLSAGRHFARELREMGFDVELVKADNSRNGLARHLRRHRSETIWTMEAADHTARRWQAGPMPDDLGCGVQVVPNTMFLIGRFNPIPDPQTGHRYVMETFYRSMRKHFGLLMEPGNKPTGGAWNFDKQNRRAIPKDHVTPRVPRFEPDAITREAMRDDERGGHGVGSVEGFDLATSREQAEAAFDDFLKHRLPDFGPFEDAIRHEESILHHAFLSPQMNLGLLEPLAMARAAEIEYREGRAPLNSAEGFIRQIIGWREFMLWQYHRQMPGLRKTNGWKAFRKMPKIFWDGQTEMRCLRGVVERLIATGYTHHIERLMIVCNFCVLAGINPAEVADWFLTFYDDSHDWVVLPNVIGMGLNADGGLTATKPYIASASYIHKMSDCCEGCTYDHSKRTGPNACPFNTLYWNFLLDHEPELKANPRLGPAVLGLRHLEDEERARVRTQAQAFLKNLEPYEEAASGE